MSASDSASGSAADWTCLDCGRSFARRGQRHVCETWTVQQHLARATLEVAELFHRFSDAVADCGPFEYAPIRVQVGFRVNRVFAGVELRKNGLHGYLDLDGRVDSPRFVKIMPYTRRLWVHRFVVTAPEQLDEEFRGWIRDGYDVGGGSHLRSRT